MNAQFDESISPQARIHARALVDAGAKIGAGTRIWAFAHVLSGAEIGEDCNICDHTFIEGGVVLGNRVTVKCGVYLWNGVVAEDDVFIGPAAVFTNDLKPRSKQDFELSQTFLSEGCSIGANSTLLAGLSVGKWALVGAGSVVTKDVHDYVVVWGNPAKFQYWICRCTRKMQFNEANQFACECGRNYLLESETEKVILCR
jgi:acetyltransferase-like isoleucine patch superfamily enzyme